MRLPPGFGSVTKQQGNRRKPYIVRKTVGVTEKGNPKRITIGWAATRKEGYEILAKYNKNPYDVNKDHVTVEDVFNMWIKYKAPYLCEKTVKDHKSKFNVYCKDIKEIPYREIKLNHFMEIISSSATSNGTKNNIKKLFRSLDRTAYEYDIIDKQYSESIPTYETSYKTRRPFTEDEINKLWDNVNIRDVDLVLIHIYTGFRPGEFVNIKVKNIDTENWFITGGAKTASGKNRLVPVHPRIRKLLLKRIDESKKGKLLNYGDKAYRIHFRTIMNLLNMEHSPYECRHTLITRLDNANVNRVCINMIVGHKSSNVGESIYTHKTPDQLQEAIASIK